MAKGGVPFDLEGMVAENLIDDDRTQIRHHKSGRLGKIQRRPFHEHQLTLLRDPGDAVNIGMDTGMIPV